MASCEQLTTCVFLRGLDQDQPAAAEALKVRFCLGRYRECEAYGLLSRAAQPLALAAEAGLVRGEGAGRNGGEP